MTAAAERCRRRFLRFFPNGFADETYREWERNYKVDAHNRWQPELNRSIFRTLLQSFLWVQGSDEYGGRSFRAAQTTSLRRAS